MTNFVASEFLSLSDSLNLTTTLLQNLAQESSRFHRVFSQTFGSGYDTALAESIRNQWAGGNWSQLPEISVVPTPDMNGSWGAYASSTNTIYISEVLITSGIPSTLVSILLEELGHAVDAQINRSDTPGDEGALFAALVQGETLTSADLTAIQNEDDSATLTLEGQTIRVEQASEIANFSVSSNTGSEANQTVITVTATASSAVSGNQTVSLAVTGTNITPGDYTLSNTTITIPNGSTTGSATFTVVNDTLVEGTETATLTISNPSSGITLGSTTSQIVNITDNDTLGILNGPDGSAEAVGPANNNDDFTNKSSLVYPYTAPGSTFDPSPVSFTNTVKNTGTASANLSLLPTAPTNPAGLPNDTVVTISFQATTATYSYNNGNFAFISGTGFVNGNPISAANPVSINNVAANGTANYGVEINLPTGTPLSTDLGFERGFPVPITAFIDTNGNGLPDDGITNITLDRVYTGYLQLIAQSRILQGTGPAVQGSDGTLSTDPKQPAPDNIIEYVVQYKNISEAQSGSGNVILNAGSVVITEDGTQNSNNWANDNDNSSAIDTSNVVGAAYGSGAGTTQYFSGNLATNLLGGEQSGTTAASDVTKYINTLAGSVAPGIAGTFTFQRKVNQTAANTGITHIATATYEDANNPGVSINSITNSVVGTIAEVAGISVTAGTPVDTNGGIVASGDLIYFPFIVTNLGNDPTGFRLPNFAATTGPGSVGVVQYSTDNGTTWTNILASEFITPSIPVNGTIQVRVPVTIALGAAPNDTLTVKYGNTPGDAQNQLRIPDGGDVYTVDNPDGTPGEVTGIPINGTREASATASPLTIPDPNIGVTVPEILYIRTVVSAEVTEGEQSGEVIAVWSNSTGNITIQIVSNNGTIAPYSTTVPSPGLITPLIIDITSNGDFIAQGNRTDEVVVNVSSSTGVTAPPVNFPVTILDDDQAGITIAQSDGSTNITEDGASDTYTIVLTSQPTANVTINLNSGTQLTTTTNSLTFTPQNWNIAQTITITAVSDSIIEGSHTSTIQHTATSSDTNYNGIAIANVIATIQDNIPPILTSPTAVSFAENGTGTAYTITATDDGLLSPLTYSLSGTDAALFAINSSTGVVTFNTSPNFEAPADNGANNVYDITVTTSDGSLTTSQGVTIAVTDANEAPAIINPTSFDISFAENSTAIVLDLEVEDPENDAITFVLAGVDAALFMISDQGDITFQTTPNFEAPTDNGGDNIYNLQVQASDATNTITQNVTVTVTDVNEAPTLTLTNTVAVLDPETDTSVPLKVADINISDDALGDETVTLNGEDANLFEVIGTALYLKAGTALDFVGNPQLKVIVEVNDPTVGNTPDATADLTIGSSPIKTLALIPSQDTPNTDLDRLIFDPTGDGHVSLDANRASQSLQVQNVTYSTDAAFDNLIGLYQVFDGNGGFDTNGDGVVDLNPGDQGYARYALTTARVQNFTLRAGAGLKTAQRIEQEGDVLLDGGSLYAPFVIANGGAIGVQGFITAEDSETSVFNNAVTTVSDMVAYFSFLGANPDGVAHLRSYGNGVFGFEDLPGNLGISDNDFNDAVFAFKLTAAV